MSEINPEKQTVAKCLSKTTYRIDFYQREYVWSKKTVEILLDDVFYAFEQSFNPIKDSELTKEVLAGFGWYYLNVIMISKEGTDRFIVDGQQRLSTLVLLCSKLYNLSKDSKDKITLFDCICGLDWHDEVYYLDHDKRKRAMDYIIRDVSITEPYHSPTEKNLVERYGDISRYIDNKQLDEKALTAFIYFVLHRIVLVELEIENYKDTPMIFEVINDRGESLKPFEILKGKLVGALSHNDSQAYSDKWDDAINRLLGCEDKFFATFIKSKLLGARSPEKETKINNEYHRYLFEDNDEANLLKVRKSDIDQISNIKEFIDKKLSYYAKLFSKILDDKSFSMRCCREIFDVESQYQLILAACEINDSNEEEKISLICSEVDRLNMLLRLNGVYDSQNYQDIIYGIATELKGKATVEYREIFNKKILDRISEKQAVGAANSLLPYGNFKKLSYDTARWFYYLFARVEAYICEKIAISPENDVFYMSTKHANKSGYHIEHIFSDNQQNRDCFKSEEEFKDQRNGVGGLLLLKGADNISSGNETYQDKLQTYSHGPVWGHTLCSEFYNANVAFSRFNEELKNSKKVEFKAYPNEFKPDDMEDRCKLLYELVKIIWDV